MGRQHHGDEGKGFGKDGPFGPDGPFGKHGPFGEAGPFGKDGPFGEGGPFGKAGPFGEGGPFGGRGFRASGKGFGFRVGPGGVEVEFNKGRGGGGRGGGRRRMFEGGELRLVLLHLIAEAPRHGYSLIKAIEEASGGEYAPSPGIVYPTLSMMVDEGVIEEIDEPGTRRAHAATPAGRAELEERADEVAELMARLAAEGGGERPERQPIKRSVANLMTALWHQMASGELDEDKLHRVAEILDKAARKIERL